jgi:hypothetical protein
MDIDMNFLDRKQVLASFKHILASYIDDNKLVKHNTGRCCAFAAV